MLESRAGELRSANTHIRSVHIITNRRIDFRLQNFVYKHDKFVESVETEPLGTCPQASPLFTIPLGHTGFFLLPG